MPQVLRIREPVMDTIGGGSERDARAPGELVWAVIHAGHDMENRIDSALEAVGLSVAKFGVLAQLAGGRLALRELAERLKCVRSNVTQLVDRLEAEGLVRRVDDPADRRSVLAELTAAGRRRHDEGADVVKRTEAMLVASLRDPESDLANQLRSGLR
jgi:DNA-binding MarR family transcriptional regulator